MASRIGKIGWLLVLVLATALGVGAAWLTGVLPFAHVSKVEPGGDGPVAAVISKTQRAPAEDGPTGFTEAEVLEHLHKLPPARRMTWLAKAVNKDRDFKPVARDSVTLAVAEPGVVTTDSMADVANLVAGNLRWIVSDGAMVKKGDKIFEIDDRPRKEQLQKYNGLIVQNSEAVRLAGESLAKLQRVTQEEVKQAKLEWKLAEIALKRFVGKDAEQKKKLELQVQQCQQALERAGTQASTQEAKVSTDLKTKKEALEQVMATHLQLEQEIARCTLLAPRQGIVIYQLAPVEKAGETRTPRLRPGEPVDANQLVVRVCDDLDHLLLAVRIDALHAGQVRPGLKAYVRVDGLPNRVFPATVKHVAAPVDNTPHKPAKVFTTKIELQGELDDLRPGMTGGARIILEERPDCLRLPLPSVMDAGKEKFCFVLTGEELHQRPITTGLANDLYVEVRSGVAQDDVVLNLQSVIRRQAEYLKYRQK